MSLMLDDVKYFATVCDTLNITRASEKIGISQPALSYSMKRLEKEIGGNLLIRLKNGIQLTKLGEEFKKRARSLIFEWENAQSLAAAQPNLIQGNYIFATHPSVAISTVEHFMPQLQDDFPKLDFSFIHGLSREMTERVISWEADFGIVVNPIKHPDLVINKLFSDTVTIFYTKKSQDKLIYDKNLAQSQYLLKKINKKSFNGVVSSTSLDVVAKLTNLGLGYGILPVRVASKYSNLQRMQNAPTYNDEICLIYRPEKHKNSISKKIIERIKRMRLLLL